MYSVSTSLYVFSDFKQNSFKMKGLYVICILVSLITFLYCLYETLTNLKPVGPHPIPYSVLASGLVFFKGIPYLKQYLKNVDTNSQKFYDTLWKSSYITGFILVWCVGIASGMLNAHLNALYVIVMGKS